MSLHQEQGSIVPRASAFTGERQEERSFRVEPLNTTLCKLFQVYSFVPLFKFEGGGST